MDAFIAAILHTNHAVLHDRPTAVEWLPPGQPRQPASVLDHDTAERICRDGLAEYGCPGSERADALVL
jgi:hypothetical protein